MLHVYIFSAETIAGGIDVQKIFDAIDRFLIGKNTFGGVVIRLIQMGILILLQLYNNNIVIPIYYIGISLVLDT
jgi:hypothetical protein